MCVCLFITEKRSNAIKKLQNGKLKCLVCSDVAARGLDIDDCDIVINYDLAPLEAIHIHRSGRTARAGSSGVCLTFTVCSRTHLAPSDTTFYRTRWNTKQ